MSVCQSSDVWPRSVTKVLLLFCQIYLSDFSGFFCTKSPNYLSDLKCRSPNLEKKSGSFNKYENVHSGRRQIPLFGPMLKSFSQPFKMVYYGPSKVKITIFNQFSQNSGFAPLFLQGPPHLCNSTKSPYQLPYNSTGVSWIVRNDQWYWYTNKTEVSMELFTSLMGFGVC